MDTMDCMDTVKKIKVIGYGKEYCWNFWYNQVECQASILMINQDD
jgi:hypothetical protein